MRCIGYGYSAVGNAAALDRQQAIITSWARRNEHEVVAVHVECCGQRRALFETVIPALQQGEADTVVVAHIDRLGRNKQLFTASSARILASGVLVEAGTGQVWSQADGAVLGLVGHP